MAWAAFFIQVVPMTFLAGIGTAVGLGFLAGRLPASFQLPIALIGLVFFIALITFREAGGWNVGLLIGFGILAGVFLGSIFPSDRGLTWGMALIAALGVLFLAAAIGSWLGERLGRWGPVLWIVSWGYLLGWVVFAIFDLAIVFQTLWALAGLLIFGGLGASWFANLMTPKSGWKNVCLAIDLFVLGLNLIVAGRVLLNSLI